MGVLIDMPCSNRAVRHGSSNGGSAEILFFTGVRYMRMPEVDPALANVTPARRAAKPRRRIAKPDSAKSDSAKSA